ncbi:MAG: NADPH-dependent FMN reductase [Desulfuromonas sp.]|nr:MAG: NADPH-dependent FMN reductase [Desulfuromonas sp.]
MKIVCLYGSPRRQGNSAELARRFLAAAEVHGAEICEYHLNNLTLRGCQGCNRCKQDLETCVLEDDLAPVLDAVFDADLVVFASPVYYGDVSAQLKMFIDRSFCYLRPGYISLDQPSRLSAPKPLVFILTQGHRDPQAFADILPRYSQLFRWIGFADVYPLRAVDVYHLGDASCRDELLREADAVAERLVAK